MSASIRRALLGKPEGATQRQMLRILRYGSTSLKIRAIREIGAQQALEAAPILCSMLREPAPGLRGAGAWALGALGKDIHGAQLLEAARQERSDGPRMAMAVAAVRCGCSVAEAWAVVEAASKRVMYTWYGERHVAESIGCGEAEMARRWRLALNPLADDPSTLTPVPSNEIRQGALSVLEKDSESRPALKALAAQQNPHDLPLLLKAQTARRTRHATTEALGAHGDPRSAAHLQRVLRDVVDPGQGFTNRRTAAEALGRLGIPDLGRALERSLTVEALEFEGRPGAGLGIQYPVRTAIITALGEAGAGRSAGTLAGYLSNTHGSAMGGFYLPAMDALWKIADVDALTPLLSSSEELIVANALGVLAMLGQQQLLEPFINDTRQRVRTVALQGG